jgi:hypothetical protein
MAAAIAKASIVARQDEAAPEVPSSGTPPAEIGPGDEMKAGIEAACPGVEWEVM